MARDASLNDPFDLQRFVKAQEKSYDVALGELRAGRKRSHWIWFIFPQIDGLAYSWTAKHYAIKSLDEAQAYLDHPVLGPRLTACTAAVLAIPLQPIRQILGAPDDLKLRSSMTLFECVSAREAAFGQVLTKFYAGERDQRTLEILGL